MGTNCSCFQTSESEKVITIEKNLEENASAGVRKLESAIDKYTLDHLIIKEISFEISLEEQDIVKIQSVFRGFIDRRKSKERLLKQSSDHIRPRSKNVSQKNSIDASSEYPRLKQKKLTGNIQMNAERRPEISEIPADSVPNYFTAASSLVLSGLGPYTHFEKIDEKSTQKRGPVQIENEAIYTGDWNKENLRHGRGVQVWSDGSIYEGYWKNDKAHGKGRLIHGNGDVYEGEWKEDKACGFGSYTHFDSSKYTGYWENDKQHGKGMEVWPDGSKFQGMYVNGLKHGLGKFEWADGSSYEGEFFENNIQGIGTYFWNDGRLYVGDWFANKMHGKGKFTWKDGRSYEGDYVDDKKQGFGIFIWPDARKYEGEWFDGKQHGNGKYFTDGSVKIGKWEKGKRVFE